VPVSELVRVPVVLDEADEDGLLLELAVFDGLNDELGMLDAEGLSLPVADELPVFEGVPVAVCVLEGVCDGVRELVRVDVIVCDTDGTKNSLSEGGSVTPRKERWLPALARTVLDPVTVLKRYSVSAVTA
jgi:hypothetical protein